MQKRKSRFLLARSLTLPFFPLNGYGCSPSLTARRHSSSATVFRTRGTVWSSWLQAGISLGEKKARRGEASVQWTQPVMRHGLVSLLLFSCIKICIAVCVFPSISAPCCCSTNPGKAKLTVESSWMSDGSSKCQRPIGAQPVCRCASAFHPNDGCNCHFKFGHI